MDSAKKVFLNTGFLYGKMAVTIILALYSTRLILNALGEVDFGIFNLIGGVISMLSFINGAMVIATQRYLSFSLGEGDVNKLKSVFSSSVILHLIIGVFVVTLLEIGSLFLFNGSLNMPEERIKTAKFIYHCMVISTFFTINAVPYDASINAHENMFFDALIGIVESVLKLAIAFVIISSQSDRLVLYGILIASLTVFIRIIKSFYCYKKYEECRISIRSYINPALIKEMLIFAGWHFLGLLCVVLKQQGTAILLNVYFGIVINAAYGIANQVNANMSNFSRNMVRAISPQITKSEGSGDRDRMLRLSIFACKVPFFLFAFFAVPLILEMPLVLKIWLKTVPENTVIFCQLILIINLLEQLTVGLSTAITSVGKISRYQTVIGLVLLLNLPLALLFIKLGFPAYSVFYGSIILELFMGGLKVWFAYSIAGLNVKDFLLKTVLNSLIALALSISLSWVLIAFMDEGFIRALTVVFVSTGTITFFSWHITLNKSDRERISEVLSSMVKDGKKKYSIFINKW